MSSKKRYESFQKKSSYVLREPAVAEDSRSHSHSHPHRVEHLDDESAGNRIPGVSKIKSLIRSHRRLLSKEDLDPAFRSEKTSSLKELEEKLKQAEHSAMERKRALKYHHVKFFERKKVIRYVERLQKQILSAEADIKIITKGGQPKGSEKNVSELALEKERVKKQLRKWERLYLYTRYYPKEKKYVSIFKSESTDTLDLKWIDTLSAELLKRDDNGFLVLQVDPDEVQPGHSQTALHSDRPARSHDSRHPQAGSADGRTQRQDQAQRHSHEQGQRQQRQAVQKGDRSRNQKNRDRDAHGEADADEAEVTAAEIQRIENDDFFA
eukprot:ANDGO_04364.mRNA.1 rRNA-processing protein EFG1